MPPNQQNQDTDSSEPANQPLVPAPQSVGGLSGGGMKVISPISSGVVAASPLNMQSPPQPLNANGSGQQPAAASTGFQAQAAAPLGVIYSNSSQDLLKSSKRQKAKLIVGAVAGVLVLVVLMAYFLLLPPLWASQYLKAIKPVYQQQSSQLSAVYRSLARPVFSSSDTTSVSNNQDFSYISGTLTTAVNNTDALKNKNHLTTLPGTGWNHTVAKANRGYQAMQQYISDSQKFLTDYKTLLTYTEQISKVGRAQLPALLGDFRVVTRTARTGNRTAVLAALQKTIGNLQDFTNQVKALKPSTDLQQFNQNLLGDLNGMDNGLEGLQAALKGNSSADVPNSLGEFETAIIHFSTLIGSNPTANLQTNSDLHNQIVNLESEHPIP